MIPDSVTGPLTAFVDAAENAAPGQLAGLYLVGGLALNDFSPRQSNIDLVAVADPPWSAGQIAALRPAERKLARAGRPGVVWYTGWDVIADGPRGDPSTWPALETPLTRALLREEAVAYMGPDWPVVAYDEGAYRDWCRRSLEALVAAKHGMMIMRKGLAAVVLEAARLAEGAATGRVFSKSEAGDAAVSLVPAHFRRILQDAAGYRNGAHASMYWGPFERKYDAQRLLLQLATPERV